MDAGMRRIRALLLRKHGGGEAVRAEIERNDFTLERTLWLAALGVFMIGLGGVERSAELVLFGSAAVAFAVVFVALLVRRLRRIAIRDASRRTSHC
jgi:hypothetical protein